MEVSQTTTYQQHQVLALAKQFIPYVAEGAALAQNVTDFYLYGIPDGETAKQKAWNIAYLYFSLNKE